MLNFIYIYINISNFGVLWEIILPNFEIIKRGSILKGKFKFVYTSLICLAVALTAGLCLFSNLNKGGKIANAVGSGNQEFSFVDSNSSVVISIEKVAVQAGVIEATGNEINTNFSHPLYTTSSKSQPTNKMLVRGVDGSAVYYKDIENGAKNPSKYVVDAYNKAEFVMLNNQLYIDAQNNNQYYYNPTLGSAYDDAQNPVQLSEAIMVSVGQYFKYLDDGNEKFGLSGQMEGSSYTDANGTETKFGKDAGANIQYIGLEARKNGQLIAEGQLPGVREFNNNRFEDFVWIIPQMEGNEGFYDFTVTYRVNGQTSMAHFSFYLLFASNYNANVADDFNNQYTTYPSFSNVSGEGKFFLGKDDIAGGYPTLTVDILKYKVGYTHTINGVSTTYDFDYRQDGQDLVLDCYRNGTLFKSSMLGARSSRANIAVIVLTEIGEYEFNFKYLYNGFNAQNAPEMNLGISNRKISINGFDLKYAKAGHNEAVMRYVKLAHPAVKNIAVGLIVPQGFLKGEETNEFELGLMYELDEESKLLAGSVVESINANLPSSGSQAPSAFADAEFVKTNQGALWFENFGTYVESGTFYYYASTLEGLKNLSESDKIAYSNMTTFNKTGFYLVFVTVHPNGMGNDASADYTAVFAFQYSADTPNVKLVLQGDAQANELGSGSYTNKNVVVSWQKPGIFEREIKVFYYRTNLNEYLKNEYNSDKAGTISREQLLARGGQEIKNNEGEVLGEDIPTNNGASYIIETKSEGKSATYSTFVIDREAIKDVAAYAVESAVNREGNMFYRFMKNASGADCALENAISSSNATLWWADKNSGAEITATYTFTPFVRDLSGTIGKVSGTNADAVWFATNYKLGETIGDFDILRAEYKGAELNSANVLFGQGIYLFTIVDEAGNYCKYMFVIDRTEAYFKLTYKNAENEEETRYDTRTSLLFTDDVTIEVGTHKTIGLTTSTSNLKTQELFEIIAASVSLNTADLNDLGYYALGDTNRAALNKIFNRLNSTSGYNYYLTVKNTALYVYNNQQTVVSTLNNITANNQSLTILATGASVYRLMYLVGVNQLDILLAQSLPTSSNSYLAVEVNTDHSQGMAYYATTQEALTNLNNLNNEGTNGAHRLRYDDDGMQTGIYATHASGENFLAFAWNMGDNSKYEVAQVEYYFYDLDITQNAQFAIANNWFDAQGTLLNNIFYYTLTTSAVTLYKNNTFNAAVKRVEGEDRVVAILNVERNMTKAGLYVVCRTYGDSFETSENEKDKKVLYYGFVVDRNGVIVQQGEINGGYISLGLKQNEMQYNNFFVSGTDTGSLSVVENNQIKNINYNIYLETNRLPAVINIPVGKYYYHNTDYSYFANSKTNGVNFFGSEYYAGKLKFDVYFNDTSNQLNNSSAGELLFSFVYDNLKNATDFYPIDFANMRADIRAKFFPAGDAGSAKIENNWIWLQGDYVVVITDMVEGINHQRTIGFRVKQSAPETDIYSLFKLADDVSKQDSIYVAGSNKQLITSQEFVVLEMQNQPVSGTIVNAELDLDYLYVLQNYDGVETEYINYNHRRISGLDIDAESDFVLLGKPHRKILLDTKLRDAQGNIVLENLNKTLTYTVKIRFNLVNVQNVNDLEKYKDCYYYYDNNGALKACYETTYTITIDRQPPENNILNLMERDNLAQFYTTDQLFENAAIETQDDIYFVKRLKTYYNSAVKDKANIYAFYVNANTPFSNADVNRVHIRALTPTDADLTLPLSPRRDYTTLNTVPAANYGEFGLETGYYEIVEQDIAGNSTQYVIFYQQGTPLDVSMGIKASYAGLDGTRVDDGVVNLSFNTNGTHTIFSIDMAETPFETVPQDRFFHIEVLKSLNGTNSSLLTLNTNFASAFDATNLGVANMFVQAIKSSGFGSYIVNITTHVGSASHTINFWEEGKITVDLSKIVLWDETGCYLNLALAKTEVSGVIYYPTQITVVGPQLQNTYFYDLALDQYYDELGNPILNNIVRLQPGAYLLVAQVANRPFYHRFNTDPTILNHNITFGADGNANHAEFDDAYYTFQQANINYNSSAYSVNFTYSIVYNGRTQTGNDSELGASNAILFNQVEIIKLVVGTNGINQLQILPYFAAENKTGALLQVNVDLIYYDGTKETSYTVFVDTETGFVSLTDKDGISTGNEFNVDLFNTAEESILQTDYAENLSGQRWLNFTPIKNDYFNYTYTLLETLQSGELREEDLGTSAIKHIDTQPDSTGVYRFVIDVYNKQGGFLGRKVYTFSVQSLTNQLYTVKNHENFTLDANSTFNMKDIFDVNSVPNPFNYTNDKLGIELAQLKAITMDLPLYVYNQQMSIQTAQDLNIEWRVWQVFPNNEFYQFSIYRIFSQSGTYNLFVGLLYVAPNQQIVENLAVESYVDGILSTTESIRPSTSLNYTFTGTGTNFVLKGEQTTRQFNGQTFINNIIKKNAVVVSVWFRSSTSERKVSDFVTNCVEELGVIKFEYALEGSGQFVFEFKDLAGNLHNFNFNNAVNEEDAAINELNIIVLKEVVLLVNGMNAIDNAYYNGQVVVQIFSPNMYDMRGITLTATLNGAPYTPTINQYTYTFSQCGTYKIVASANVENETLTRVLVFTIINENEAHEAVDLTTMFDYNIASIHNNRGENITQKLVALLNQNQNKDKYLLTYNLLVEHAEELGIGSGKQTLTFEYFVRDGIYPVRAVEVAFTFNNEKPNIECNVKSGGTTKSSFTITFNPGIIYDQVGDCSLYINDQLVTVIDQSSAYSVQTVTKSFKADGAGEYYIVLRGTSGNVHSSYKVVIKEPLNRWSIVFIVIITLIVCAIIGIIIFLRVKMKIR